MEEEDFSGFTQAAPEVVERQAFEPVSLPISATERETLVSKTMRYMLLKGGRGEPVKKTSLNDDVLGPEYRRKRGVTNAILHEASHHLERVFGYEVHEAPKGVFSQSRFKDCFYVVNQIKEEGHCVRLNAVGTDESVALKGLLMVVLAFTHTSTHDNRPHKISHQELVDHLHKLSTWASKECRDVFAHDSLDGILDTFSKQHYLSKERLASAEGPPTVVYELGPRALLEVGRKQILTFSYQAAGMPVDAQEIAAIDKTHATGALSAAEATQ